MKRIYAVILSLLMIIWYIPQISFAEQVILSDDWGNYWPDVTNMGITFDLPIEAGDGGVDFGNPPVDETPPDSGIDLESNIDWVYDNGLLRINGQGDMLSYENATPPWNKYKDSIRLVIIENGVTHIGDFAFFNLPVLEELAVADSVESIGFATVSPLSKCKIHTKNNAYASEFYKTSGFDVCVHDTGMCGNEVMWQMVSDSLYIYGKGSTFDYSQDKLPGWSDKYDQIKNIYVNPSLHGSKVTGLGSYLFHGESGATLYVTSNLEYIGYNAMGYESFDGINSSDNYLLKDYYEAYGYPEMVICSSLPEVDWPETTPDNSEKYQYVTLNFYSADRDDAGRNIAFKRVIYTSGENNQVPAPEIIEKTGWTALGWRDDTEPSGAEYDTDIKLNNTGSADYYSVYSKTVNATFSAEGVTQNIAPVSGLMYFNASGKTSGATVRLADAPARPGMDFDGWKCDELDSVIHKAGDVIEIDGDYNFEAVWSEAEEIKSPLFVVANVLGGKEVSISADEGCQVYLTLNGDKPSTSSEMYLKPIKLTKPGTTTIKVMPVKNGVAGKVVTKEFVVQEAPAPKRIHPSGNIYTTISFEPHSDIPGSEIYYRINGGEFKLFTAATEVKSSTTIRVYLRAPGYADSRIEDYSYKFVKTVETPVIEANDTVGGKFISVTCNTNGALIYYTTDGSAPDESSNLYTGTFVVMNPGTTTIRAVAFKDGMRESTEASTKITFSKLNPATADVGSGSYSKFISIKMNETSGTDVYYTLDGTTPSTSSIKYTGPITISKTTTLKTIRVGEGYGTSKINTYTYVIEDTESEVGTAESIWARRVNNNSVEFSATVNSEGGNETNNVVFTYCDRDGGVRYKTAAQTSDGINYTATVSNLVPGTEYSYYATISNSAGSADSEINTFVTDDEVVPYQVSILQSAVALRREEVQTLAAKVLPSNARDCTVIWKSSDKNVVTVSPDGKITAIGTGKAIITATSRINRAAYGTCTVIVSNNAPGGVYDFSEWNMFTNTKSFAENGRISSDGEGGVYTDAMRYLARWDGPVLEINDPYHTSGWATGSNAAAKNFAYMEDNYHEIAADFHVQDMAIIPVLDTEAGNQLDVDGINEYKTAIMKFGAVSNSYYSINNSSAPAAGGAGYQYFPVEWDYKEWSAAKKNRTGGGHAIALVGWDDNIPADYFKRKCKCGVADCEECAGKKYYKPAGDGAFICRNSWGEDFGDEGYFYISYYDKYLLRRNDGMVVTSLEHKTNYDKIYQYDPYLNVCSYYWKGHQRVYESNVFPESRKTLEADEILKAVAFCTDNECVDYKIYVVKDFKSKEKSFKNKMFLKEGRLENAGYHTINLDTPVQLSKGTRFAVVVELVSKAGNLYIPFECNETYKSNGEVKDYIVAQANSDESFLCFTSGGNSDWYDVFETWSSIKNANVCVKAFTDTVETQGIAVYQAIDNENRIYSEAPEYFGTSDELPQPNVNLSDSNNYEVNGPGTMSSVITLEGNDYYESTGYSLPARYDLREQITMPEIRDQLSWGSCWTFAAYASLETALMKKLATASAGLNISEDNYSTYLNNISIFENIPAGKIELDSYRKTVAVGSRERIAATVYPAIASDRNVVWHSSDESVAPVDAFGYVTALKNGTATITATTVDGNCVAACSIEVVDGKRVESISIKPKKVAESVSSTFFVDYEIYPSACANSKVTWRSGNTDLLIVDEYGVFTALGEGIAEVFVTTEDGSKTDSVTVEIKNSSANVRISDMVTGASEQSGKVTASPKLTVESSGARKAYAVCAAYTTEGNMLCVSSKPVVLTAGSAVVVFEDMNFGIEQGTEYIFKGIILNKKETLEPLCEAFVVD